MEHKSQITRKPAKAVARVAAIEPPCGLNGKLTAARDGAIRIDTDVSHEPARVPQPLAKALQKDKALQKGHVEVVETYFDAAGRPIKRKSLGAARVARAYDARGNQVEEAYFNAEGKPTVPKDVGAARISWRYDDSGKRIEAAFFGADGSPIRRPGRKRAAEGV